MKNIDIYRNYHTEIGLVRNVMKLIFFIINDFLLGKSALDLIIEKGLLDEFKQARHGVITSSNYCKYFYSIFSYQYNCKVFLLFNCQFSMVKYLKNQDLVLLFSLLRKLVGRQASSKCDHGQVVLWINFLYIYWHLGTFVSKSFIRILFKVCFVQFWET